MKNAEWLFNLLSCIKINFQNKVLHICTTFLYLFVFVYTAFSNHNQYIKINNIKIKVQKNIDSPQNLKSKSH